MRMNEQQLILTYERILAATGLMLDAARQGDWDRLTGLERGCRAEVDGLIALGDGQPQLPEPLRKRKTQIIRSVLADDAEIRRITEPAMSQLEQLIGNLGNQRKLAKSYGAQPLG
jgi:flagellar protein FliT